MRSALIISKVESPDLIFGQEVIDDAISMGLMCESLIDHTETIDINGYAWEIYASMWIGPHVDDSVIGNYTVGIILASGGQILFTGNGREVAQLNVGNVYLLNNRKQHGAKANGATSPLVIAMIDFIAEGMKEAKIKADQILTHRLKR